MDDVGCVVLAEPGAQGAKAKVKLTLAKGASVDDPTGIFNSSLGGGTRRAVDITEGEELDPDASRELIRAAVARNEP